MKTFNNGGLCDRWWVRFGEQTRVYFSERQRELPKIRVELAGIMQIEPSRLTIFEY